MTARYNLGQSSVIGLIGAFPEGSLIGQDAYIADSKEEDDIFGYIDDLEIADLVSLAGILYKYNICVHVPSDIAVDQKFLNPLNTRVQEHLYFVNNWTKKQPHENQLINK